MADLTDRQLRILRLVQYGRGRTDYLIDGFGVDTTSLNRDLEHLDQEGYMARLAGTGYDFFSFILLPKGEAVLPPLSDLEQRLRPDNLLVEGLRILRYVEAHPGSLFWGISDGATVHEAELLSFLNYHINETGYLKDGGFWRRTYFITPRGKEVLAKHADLAAARKP